MKRLLIFVIVLLTFSAPVLAQTLSADPAAYLPSDIPAYLEIETDSAGLDALNQLMTLGYAFLGVGASSTDVIDTLSSAFPAGDLRSDVLPWLGDHIGVGILNIPLGGKAADSGTIFVLPIRDANAAQAFVTKISATPGITTESVGGISVYKTDTYGLAVGSDVMWFSSPSGIDTFLKAPMLQRLTDNPHYQKVRAALPADAVIRDYVSGAFVGDTAAQEQANASPDSPSPAALLEATLRLHPAQSAMEDALLKFPGLNGLGFALQVSDSRLDLTGILSLDATYPAPTLTTASAGTALLDLIPGNSFAVFDSYDLTATTLPVVGLALLGATIGHTFDTIVAELQEGTPAPTPTPTPSPTPTPPMTADTIIAQVQPILNQIQSTLGLSLDQLYSLIDGEYAIAVFPGPAPTIGAALYLQSSDPQQIIDTLDHASKLVLVDPSSGQQLITPTQTTVQGVPVTIIQGMGFSDSLALALLDDHTMILTTESLLPPVISAAQSHAGNPALQWRDAFGTAQEALFYVDPRTVDLYSLRQQRNPPLPLTALAGSFDAQDNGLFVLHLAATTGS